MRDDFLNAWETLELPWRESLELAWQSCAAGTVGVGSVITDSNGAIVARGRNRVYDGRSGTEILRDTPIAHAEMNAFATLSSSIDLTQAHPLVEPATLPALRGRICFHACRDLSAFSPPILSFKASSGFPN